jgi:hypothetical protein
VEPEVPATGDVCCAAGLKAGKTFIADEPGELVADWDEQPAAAAAAGAGAAAAAAPTPEQAQTEAGSTAAAAAAGAGDAEGAAAAGAHAVRQTQKQHSKKSSRKQAKQQQQQQQQEGEAEPKKGITFSSYDRQVLQQLPAFIQQQVPFLTTAKGAIDTTLLQLFKLLAVSDVGFNNLVSRLHELHHWQYYKQMLIYYSFAACVKQLDAARRGKHCRVDRRDDYVAVRA